MADCLAAGQSDLAGWAFCFFQSEIFACEPWDTVRAPKVTKFLLHPP
jgi:hypothetical protein